MAAIATEMMKEAEVEEEVADVAEEADEAEAIETETITMAMVVNAVVEDVITTTMATVTAIVEEVVAVDVITMAKTERRRSSSTRKFTSPQNPNKTKKKCSPMS